MMGFMRPQDGPNDCVYAAGSRHSYAVSPRVRTAVGLRRIARSLTANCLQFRADPEPLLKLELAGSQAMSPAATTVGGPAAGRTTDVGPKRSDPAPGRGVTSSLITCPRSAAR